MGCDGSKVDPTAANFFFVANATGQTIWAKSSDDRLVLERRVVDEGFQAGGGTSVKAGYGPVNVGAQVNVEKRSSTKAVYSGGKHKKMGYCPVAAGKAIRMTGKYIKILSSEGETLCYTREALMGRSFIVTMDEKGLPGVLHSKLLKPNKKLNLDEVFTDELSRENMRLAMITWKDDEDETENTIPEEAEYYDEDAEEGQDEINNDETQADDEEVPDDNDCENNEDDENNENDEN